MSDEAATPSPELDPARHGVVSVVEEVVDGVAMQRILLVRDDGQRSDFGLVAGRRETGRYDLIMSYDDDRGMWWILAITRAPLLIIQPMGWTVANRAECWGIFQGAGEARVEKLIADSLAAFRTRTVN